MRPMLLLSPLLAALCTGALAQTGVEIDSSRIELQVQPGASVNSTVNVRHPGTVSSQPMTVRPYVRDMAVPVRGTQTFPPAGTTPNSLGKWIQVTPSTFSIAPGSTSPVRYTVTVPAGTAPGLYWGTLFFEANAGKAEQKAGSTAVNYKVDVGQIIYVQVGTGQFGGRLTGLNAQVSGDSVQVDATIANDGTTLIRAAGRAQVRDQGGKVVVTVPIDESVALPGNRRTFAGEEKLNLPKGKYVVLVAMQYAPGKFFTGQTALEVK